MTNEERLMPFIKQLYNKLISKDFVIDKTGVKLVELIAPRIELDPSQPLLDFGVKKTNKEYCEKELKWYLSENLNIEGYVDDIKIWKQVSDRDGYVNSNYGYLIYSDKNYNQFDHCLNELCINRESRRAIMIYNRPSMHLDYNKQGMSDFICCLANQFLIRDNKLISIVEFRSQDFIFGFFNDLYWKIFVYNRLLESLRQREYSELETGNLIWIANSLHIYESHFPLLEKIIANYK